MDGPRSAARTHWIWVLLAGSIATTHACSSFLVLRPENSVSVVQTSSEEENANGERMLRGSHDRCQRGGPAFDLSPPPDENCEALSTSILLVITLFLLFYFLRC